MTDCVRTEHGCEYHLTGRPESWAYETPSMLKLRAAFKPAELEICKLCAAMRGKGPILFAGPWIGEFGWELARWQGRVRKAAGCRQQAAGWYIIVMGDVGHHLLYPYAHEYWEVPRFFREAGFTRQCDHVRGGPFDRGHKEIAAYLRLLAWLIARELASVGPVHMTIQPQRFRPDEQDIVRLNVPDAARWRPEGRYFCVLPRLRSWNPQKNWPAFKWLDLMAALQGDGSPYGEQAMVVGAPDEVRTLQPEYACEERWSLHRSIALLGGAEFAIAPESGGALLSLLCGCPTVVFGHMRNKKRITADENFLSTPVHYVARNDYSHSAAEVLEGVRALLRDMQRAA